MSPTSKSKYLAKQQSRRDAHRQLWQQPPESLQDAIHNVNYNSETGTGTFYHSDSSVVSNGPPKNRYSAKLVDADKRSSDPGWHRPRANNHNGRENRVGNYHASIKSPSRAQAHIYSIKEEQPRAKRAPSTRLHETATFSSYLHFNGEEGKSKKANKQTNSGRTAAAGNAPLRSMASVTAALKGGRKGKKTSEPQRAAQSLAPAPRPTRTVPQPGIQAEMNQQQRDDQYIQESLQYQMRTSVETSRSGGGGGTGAGMTPPMQVTVETNYINPTYYASEVALGMDQPLTAAPSAVDPGPNTTMGFARDDSGAISPLTETETGSKDRASRRTRFPRCGPIDISSAAAAMNSVPVSVAAGDVTEESDFTEEEQEEVCRAMAAPVKNEVATNADEIDELFRVFDHDTGVYIDLRTLTGSAPTSSTAAPVEDAQTAPGTEEETAPEQEKTTYQKHMEMLAQSSRSALGKAQQSTDDASLGGVLSDGDTPMASLSRYVDSNSPTAPPSEALTLTPAQVTKRNDALASLLFCYGLSSKLARSFYRWKHYLPSHREPNWRRVRPSSAGSRASASANANARRVSPGTVGASMEHVDFHSELYDSEGQRSRYEDSQQPSLRQHQRQEYISEHGYPTLKPNDGDSGGPSPAVQQHYTQPTAASRDRTNTAPAGNMGLARENSQNVNANATVARSPVDNGNSATGIHRKLSNAPVARRKSVTMTQQIDQLYNDPNARREFIVSRDPKLQFLNTRDESPEELFVNDAIYPLVCDNEQTLWLLYCHYCTNKDVVRYKMDLTSHYRYRKPLLLVTELFHLCKDFGLVRLASSPEPEAGAQDPFPLLKRQITQYIDEVFRISNQDRSGMSPSPNTIPGIALCFADYIKILYKMAANYPIPSSDESSFEQPSAEQILAQFGRILAHINK